MPARTGAGAYTAMVDAVVLGRAVAGASSLDEALSAKITGMIMDAYNPPYVESLLVDGIGPAMDEAFSVLMAAGVLRSPQQFAPTWQAEYLSLRGRSPR